MTLRPLTLMGIIISIVTGIALGVLAHLWSRDDQPVQASRTLIEAMREINSNYVEEINQDELLGHAIEGMIRGLDPHSDYLDPAAFESLQTHTTGKFGGIGIELGMVDGYFTVIAPMDDTPAANAGMQAGDRITRINDESVRGMKLIDLIRKMRGAPGTTVALGILRKDQSQPINFTLTRQQIEIASVRGRMLEPGYGYLRISQFQNNTGRALEETLHELTKQGSLPLAGLVLDLRNNPGGTLQSSVEVADHFLEKGLIVYTEGRLRSSFGKYKATEGDTLAGAPIVVLINSGSASASEIVAGALQDHGRATLIGSTSYGKGSVQSVLPLRGDQALKLTTAYYFTPNGRTIHETGIEPDIALEGDNEAMLAEALVHLKAAPDVKLQARLTSK